MNMKLRLIWVLAYLLTLVSLVTARKIIKSTKYREKVQCRKAPHTKPLCLFCSVILSCFALG